MGHTTASSRALRLYGFLYGDDEPMVRQAENLLVSHCVGIKRVSLLHTPQPGMNFVAPTFVTRQGTFRGFEAIEAFVAWYAEPKSSAGHRAHSAVKKKAVAAR